MAKKSKRQYEKDELELIGYQWESLRTNPDYINDYQRYHKIWTNPKIEYARFYPRIEFFFYKKYGISPHDPSIPFPERNPLDSPKKPSEKHSDYRIKQIALWFFLYEFQKAARCLSPELEIDFENLVKKRPHRISHNAPMSEEYLRQKLSIVVLINLDAPITRIVREVTKIYNDWQKKRRPFVGDDLTRKRLSEYRNYFKVYRCVNEDMDWSKIAKKTYPADAERDLNYAKRKVKRDYDRWKTIGMQFQKNPLINHRTCFGIPEPPELISNKKYFDLLRDHCLRTRHS